MRPYPDFKPNDCPHNVIEPKRDKIRNGFEYFCKSCGEVVCDSFEKEGEVVQGKPTRLTWAEKEDLR